MLPSIPKQIYRGSSVSCSLALDGYLPSEGWAATLILRGGAKHNVEGTAAVDSFAFSLPTDMTVGRYWWQVIVQRESEQQVAQAGELVVMVNLLDVDTFDGRTEAQIALDAINAVLANRATKDQQSYKIKDRELQRMSVDDLLKLRSFFVSRVNKERGKGGIRSIGVRL